MNLKLIHGVGEFFALDIGTTGIRVVELGGNMKSGFVLQKFAYVPVEAKVLQDDSDAGKRHLGEIVLGALKQAGITTKNVAVGLPAGKTFTTIIELPMQEEEEIKQTIKYQLDKYIPMSADEAKADYVILGQSPNDTQKVEVLISSTSIRSAEDELEKVESWGLNVIAEEPEPIAMARALMPMGMNDARMIVDFGDHAADLVITYQNAPRLVRSIPGGFSAFIKTVASVLSVKEEQARQFVLKFGLAQDKLEGQIFQSLDGQLEGFTQEIMKSVGFFQSRYMNAPVGGIVLSGFAGEIPLLAEFIEAKTGIATGHGNPWQRVKMTPEQQNALAPVANEFAVAIGLAERSNE